MGRGGFRVELEGARLRGGGEQAALLSLFRFGEEGAATRGLAADVFYRAAAQLQGGRLRRGGVGRLLAFACRFRGGRRSSVARRVLVLTCPISLGSDDGVSHYTDDSLDPDRPTDNI